jgi:exonuclease SbcC
MQLLRLRIRNIASLRGEQEINFREIQEQSPLFAITGETGAGKSTILNCVGLALYGDIYKKNVNQPDVVTLGEKDAAIELLFQVKGKVYLADWRIRVLRQDGRPYAAAPAAQRTLYVVDGDTFAEPRTATAATAAELLNLDFDQFCKCIILNQGEFARFLTSSFSERKDILEKLYPGVLLDNISRELEQEKRLLEKARHDTEIELQALRGTAGPGDDLALRKGALEAELALLERARERFGKLDSRFAGLLSAFDKYHDTERRKAPLRIELLAVTGRYNNLLKRGEGILATAEELRRRQETEVPVLQTFLEKENTLKHLEDGCARMTRDLEALAAADRQLDEELAAKGRLESERAATLAELAGALSYPLDELRPRRDDFRELFDLSGERELLAREIAGKGLRLKELEETGSDLKAQVDGITEAIEKLPPNARELEERIRARRQELQARHEDKQRAEIRAQELRDQVEAQRRDLARNDEEIGALELLLKRTEGEILPFEATLKLQEVITAAGTCVAHALAADRDTCPVCEGPVPRPRWEELRVRLQRTDLDALRAKFEEGQTVIAKGQRECQFLREKAAEQRRDVDRKVDELNVLEARRTVELPALAELDQDLDRVRKEALLLAQLTRDKETREQELLKIRRQYKELRDNLTRAEAAERSVGERLANLLPKFSVLFRDLTPDVVRELKHAVRILEQSLEEERALEVIRQELSFLRQKKEDGLRDRGKLDAAERTERQRIAELKAELDRALGGERASVLIQRITAAVHAAADAWARHAEAQRREELAMNNTQVRLTGLEDLGRSYDLQFADELHQLRALAAEQPEREESRGTLERLATLSLGFADPRELFVSVGTLIAADRERFRAGTDDCRTRLATVATQLAQWEALQDRIRGLEARARDLGTELDRKLRLFEVLGRDELRTFVLSRVEENLIYQTNEELQKLCQGRYEIVHQTRSLRLSPEFYILDKFRGGGRRKVSTLSGGETFMVSLAMALGLAELTRGQAEIDSLFIDEGFGTLDQDSLEDVLDMLQQIQTRGLLVGIISHVKPLTAALPVNLVLKKQTDGTSTITLQHN